MRCCDCKALISPGDGHDCHAYNPHGVAVMAGDGPARLNIGPFAIDLRQGDSVALLGGQFDALAIICNPDHRPRLVRRDGSVIDLEPVDQPVMIDADRKFYSNSPNKN